MKKIFAKNPTFLHKNVLNKNLFACYAFSSMVKNSLCYRKTSFLKNQIMSFSENAPQTSHQIDSYSRRPPSNRNRDFVFNHLTFLNDVLTTRLVNDEIEAFSNEILDSLDKYNDDELSDLMMFVRVLIILRLF